MAAPTVSLWAFAIIGLGALRRLMTLSASSPASGRPRLCWWRSTSARSDSRK
ncbi:Uncharacterised protein [Bordetella pertussis]|nr:Uncharacterised protein [Bordetella pertussis]